MIQKISSSEKEKLQEFLKEQERTADWETFAHENGTILLHDHRVSEYAEEQALEQLGNTIEVYDLVPVGTDMSGLLPETLVNCGYLDITKEGFPELELCWDGRNTNLLLVTEETFENLSENLTPQTFEMSFSVEKEQESGCKNRLKGMIQTENMEFQSENGYAEQLNLFQMECRSDLLLKRTGVYSDQQTVASGNQWMPDFYRDYEFFKCKGNGHVTSKKRMCHYESCGNDQKAVAADVPCRRNFYLAVAECSDIDRWYNIALRDWMVYENRDILFCFFLSNQRNGCSTDDFTCRQYSGTRNFL